jgi:excisionase family DNA binding protein
VNYQSSKRKKVIVPSDRDDLTIKKVIVPSDRDDLTINEYAAWKGCSRRTVQKWIANRVIPFLRVERVVRINRWRADEALRRLERKAVEA